ncbi:ankyrin repeat domain-containing protein [Olivibacter sp. SDN3]|uniref:ankyrin repeat domain-containing protein n=1 Tax=Olivibacter sp. SDN3 TaxID=2764720 RepID=UPI0016517AD5|nr:ankyrin repeat domain-containing protein [Olivibacter sp. SDN3]QNL48193.1 ankyrin repeat domain-containing protein [Olivibacter sp. SDN3]
MTNNDLRDITNTASKSDTASIITMMEDASLKVEFDTHALKSALSQLIRSSHYPALDLLVKENIISTDLYDYDRFDTSIMRELLTPILSSQDAMDAYVGWLRTYLEQVEDIDEDVNGLTLLEFSLELKAPVPIIKAIAAAGADVHRMDKNGQNLLFKVCNLRMLPAQYLEELVDWLLEEGIDLNAVSVERKTPLHVAIDSGKPEIAIKLIEAGADPNAPNTNGETSFFLAAVHQQNADLLEHLLQYQIPDFYAQTKQGENLLNGFLRMMYQETPRNLKIIDLLLSHGADLKESSLWYHQEKTGVDWMVERSADLLQMVLEKGYLDVDYRDNLGNTLLHKVCRFDINFDANKARDLYKKVKFLIKSGVDTTVENTEDKKAVDYAMGDDLKTKTVELLLKNQ